MTALTLAREGQDVLLVDVKKEIPQVNRCCCTALITEPNTHGDSVSIQDNNIHFEKNNFTVRYTGQWVKLEKSIRLSPGGKKLTMTNVKGVAWPYSKDDVLRNLLEDLVAAGADILTETAALKAENVNGGVKVTLRGCSSRALKDVRCKVAVAADGVNSQIVKGLELFKTEKIYHFISCGILFPGGRGGALSQFLDYLHRQGPHQGRQEPAVHARQASARGQAGR